ncbi:hypothetical protein GTG28_05530 [Vibrio sp. OCN044]|uniref:Uncharacterized protein n=1 Tax=Vibrio tetraodonis subsp. pristinus TaxID=2695891 RepID=A0A6L8LRJ3_9VIBR|nr:hypothetical protein [Vibrio tetraodonis]MYM58677.1 hypothetical protein [Vibrio tetraodonis subsp. pristinus]
MKFYKADEYQISCEVLYREYELKIAALLADDYREKKSAFIERVLRQ